MKQYRHGDILLVTVEQIDTSHPVGSKLLAEGEGKNHGHFIEGEVEVYDAASDPSSTHFLEVRSSANLRHLLIDSGIWTGEHADIQIEPGRYRVVRQREFDPYSKVIREIND